MKSHTSRNPTVSITTAVAASTDAGLRPLSSCGGIDGLGILAGVSASIDAGLWSPSSSGSTDGFSIPASVDDVADGVIWSRCAVSVMMPWVCLMVLLLFQMLAPSC